MRSSGPFSSLCRLLVLWIACQLGACHLVFPFPSGTADQTPQTSDQGALDRPRLDRGAPDQAPTIPDRGGDGASEVDQSAAFPDIGFPDIGFPDIGFPDIGSPDIGFPDIGSPDQGGDSLTADSSASSPCAGGNVLWLWPIPNMAICEDPAGGSYTQCDVHLLCNASANWTLCTSDEYRDRSQSASGWNDFAWIKGCIRDKGKPKSPTNDLCPSCDTSTNTSYVSAWDCITEAPSFNVTDEYLGLATAGHCWMVGEFDVANAAFWRPYAAGKFASAAVCCLQP